VKKEKMKRKKKTALSNIQVEVLMKTTPHYHNLNS
jgi:hypothetical protein